MSQYDENIVEWLLIKPFLCKRHKFYYQSVDWGVFSSLSINLIYNMKFVMSCGSKDMGFNEGVKGVGT